VANRLYRYDGKHFVDVAPELGIDVKGETRQVSWIDFDNDGRLDLFVAFRDAPNMLFHNDGSKFVDLAKDTSTSTFPSDGSPTCTGTMLCEQ
jgi:hypothetical protein